MNKYSDSSTNLLDIKNFPLFDKNCDYLGEGNCHIVLAIKENGHVLRLRKVDSIKSIPHPKAYEFEMLSNELLFCNTVMKFLIGKHFVYPLDLVSLDQNEVSSIISKINHKRKLCRRSKIINCNFGMLSLDFTSNKLIDWVGKPSLCIEIKGKQGWFPDHLKKYKKCFYCMNQYLKLKKGSISSVSGYCPLDLFSGDFSRMYLALSKLFEKPQNNLRISSSGIKIYDENSNISGVCSSLMDHFRQCGMDINNPVETLSKVIIKSLLWNENKDALIDNQEAANFENCTDRNYCDERSSHLPLGCVLGNILQIQLLEKEAIIDNVNSFSEFEYVNDLILLFEDIKEPLDFAKSTKFNSIQKYMLASIAKDCSIMISIKPFDRSSDRLKDEIFIEENNHSFIVKVGVIDIGPKPCSKINDHKKRDKDVLENFLNI